MRIKTSLGKTFHMNISDIKLAHCNHQFLLMAEVLMVSHHQY